MAKVDVVNLRGKGRHARAGRRGIRAERGERGAAVGGGEALPRRAAPGHARHKEPQAGRRLRQEAVEAEGHGPGPRRLGAFAALASRRYGAWTAAAQLRLRLPAEEAAGRTALGACGEAGRRQADSGRFARDQEPKRSSITPRSKSSA